MNSGKPPHAALGLMIQQALALINQGRLAEAEPLCRAVLKSQPRDFNAAQLLGHIALRRNDYAAAEQWLNRAVAINPGNAAVQSNRAVALLALGRAADALASSERAIALNPAFAEAHSNRGRALCALGEPAEGLACYERALALAPGLQEAHRGRIGALQALERHEAALVAADVALRTVPDSAELWSMRGAVLAKLHRAVEALAAFDRALSLRPDFADAWNNRGTALRDLRQPEVALQAVARALELRPQFAEALCNLANLRLDAGQFAAAIDACERALAIRSGMVDALSIRGAALRFAHRYTEAAADYRRLLALAPGFEYAAGHLFWLQAALCDWAERAVRGAGILAAVERGERAASPHTFLAVVDAPAAQLQCARTYVANFPVLAPLWSGARRAHERMRIAYLSADFHDHPVAHLMAGVWERHDRRRFETIGVSLRREVAGDAMHGRVRRAFEQFHDVSEVSDRDVAELLRRLEVDVAVDLNTHTHGGRLGILAYRPAPIQVNFLGFAGSSGAACVDYVLADAVAVPVGHERFFSERIVRLPHCFLPNDDGQPIGPPPRRRDLGLPDAGFVFCAFNNPYKLNPTLFDIWMGLLRETPGSVLWLRGGEPTLIANLEREARSRGVDPARLVFAPRVASMDAHLARYCAADLFLDTLPYGAHATARDALWAGLPVLTCAGDAFASRVAASLLGALGMPELVTSSLADYAARALDYAREPARLLPLRQALVDRSATSPAFQTDLYRRHLEAAFTLMCERHQRGAPPQSFDVPPLA
jgi:predicted O-linked N-acetylglucosamine transferase (SPINDLY family)